MKTVIEMAREAGWKNIGQDDFVLFSKLSRFAALVREDEREEQQEPVVCHDCNGSGEMETGIGMMVCDSCHGSCVKGSLTVQNHSGEAADMVAEQERAPITEPVVPWLSHKVVEQAEQEPLMDYERINALREGEQNVAEDAYFFVRPENDTPSLRKMFCQGFERGFHKGLKYAAPVRTKDLTDDEISKVWDDSSYGDSGIDFARAVIAADREKNK